MAQVHYTIGRQTGPLPYQWQYRFYTVDHPEKVHVPPGWVLIQNSEVR
jgi:hypothetical protein